MAYTIMFRPVVIGDPEEPGPVFWLMDEPEGKVYFRDMEWSWPLDARPLEAVSLDDIPEYYRKLGIPITILPVQEVTAASEAEVWDLMLAGIRQVQWQGVAVERKAA